MKKIIALLVLFMFAGALAGFTQDQAAPQKEKAAKQEVQKPAQEKAQPVKAQPAKTAKVVYTCPKHPDVTSDKPGKCPKCNATLEKKEVAQVVYTCPMHPSVTSDKPGKCPKCGMNLEKKEEKKPGKP